MILFGNITSDNFVQPLKAYWPIVVQEDKSDKSIDYKLPQLINKDYGIDDKLECSVADIKLVHDENAADPISLILGRSILIKSLQLEKAPGPILVIKLDFTSDISVLQKALALIVVKLLSVEKSISFKL